MMNRRKISVLLLFAALLAAVGVSFAVFTYQANKKGVISTEEVDTYFTSNYLKLCGNNSLDESSAFSEFEGQTLVFSDDETQDTVSFDFTVQNYIVAGTHNQYTIQYNLVFVLQSSSEYGTLSSYEIIDMDTASEASIKKEPFSENKKIWESVQYSLSGGYDSKHTYRIKVPKDALDKVQLLVAAQPTIDSLRYTNDKMLAVVFSPCTDANIKAFEVGHAFNDRSIKSNGEIVMPYQLDAFNYMVSINTSSARITLTWDPNCVTIDPYFINRVTDGVLSNGADDKKVLTFTMNTSSCLIQFYRTAAKDETAEWQKDWTGTGMESVIQVEGKEFTSTGGTQTTD